jgi:hypothetical protein
MRIFWVGLLIVAVALSQPTKAPKIEPATKEGSADASKQDKTTKGDQPAAAKGTTAINEPKPSIQQTESKAANEETNINRRLAQYTGGLVLVGFLQCVVLYLQVHYLRRAFQETRRASDLTRQSLVLAQRPKVIVRNVSVSTKDGERISPSQVPQGFDRVQFYVSNVGGVVARTTRWHGEVFIGERLPMDSPYEGKAGTEANISLPPGVAHQLEFTTAIADKTWLEFNKKETMNFGERFLWIIGWVEYVDELGNTRRTAFCRRWEIYSLRFVPVEDSEYEHAD